MAGGPVAAGGGIDGGSSFVGILMACFAAFGGILFGYDTGLMSGILAMDDWLQTFGEYDSTLGWFIRTNNKSLVVSILSAGTFFGALGSYPAGHHLGRRYGIMLACVVFCLGVGLQLHTKWAAFIVGRVFAGLGVGCVSCLVPQYQSEVAPKKIRGLVVGMYQLAVTLGLVLAAVVDNATKGRPDHSAWRIPIAIQFVWAGILCSGMFFLPESPRWLLLKGKDEQARKAMGRLTGRASDDVEVHQACLDVTAAIEAERAISNASWGDLFTMGPEKNLLRVLTGIMMQGFQQLTGCNFIFYYGTTFFASIGMTNSFVSSLIVNIINMVTTVPGILAVDRFGRRSLLIWGAVWMCTMEFLIAIIGVTAGDAQADGTVNAAAQKCLIALTCLYVAAFASTWGPIAWIVIGEIFPLEIKSKGMALSVMSNWLWNWAIGYATPYLVDRSTTGVNGVKTAHLGVKVFFIWGGTCACCIAFAYFVVPETKGLSLEQVDLMYRESSSAWYGIAVKSNQARARILATEETFTHPTHGDILDHEHKLEKEQV